MKHRSHRPRAERETRSRLAQQAQEADVLCGRLVSMRRTCGKSHCRCTTGELHESLYLSINVRGKRKMIYIPDRLAEMVQRAVQEHQALRERVQRLSDICLERLMQQKRERRL